MRAMTAIAAVSIVATAANPASLPASHIIYGSDHALIGVTGLGARCSPGGGSCVDFDRVGTLTKIERNRHGDVTAITLRTNGFYSESGKIYPLDMAFGDAAMDLADPPSPTLMHAVSKWLRPGMHVLVAGTLSGADGGMMIATSVRDMDH